jgi:hypothetical protein
VNLRPSQDTLQLLHQASQASTPVGGAQQAARLSSQASGLHSHASSAASEALGQVQLIEQRLSLRRLGPLEEEQVELNALLGRGSYGRVYRGAPSRAGAPRMQHAHGLFSRQLPSYRHAADACTVSCLRCA